MNRRLSELDSFPRFTFVRRPISLPPDLRPVWRLAALCLILNTCCRGKKSRLGKLHVLSWSLKSRRAQHTILEPLDGRSQPTDLIVRVEPSLIRAIDFGLAEGLFQGVGGKVCLTERGLALARTIQGMEGTFAAEKAFLGKVGLRLTDSFLKRLTQAKGIPG
jgi:hypothetical protein